MPQTVTATFGELLELTHDPFDPQLIEFFEPDEELVYQVRTPTGEARADPPGILIYISPKPGARMPDAWGQVLDQHNLMWVGAQDSGNEVHVARRVAFALLAPAVAAQVEAIDATRLLLTGFSGGGRVASMMMPAYPDRYAGALFICGANPLLTATQHSIDALGRLPMVFLTGTGDFNLEDTQVAISTYQQAGMARTQLMVVDGLGHGLPEATDLDTALEYFR
jgi:poly(3-hydroxybutyrate) depolymerase